MECTSRQKDVVHVAMLTSSVGTQAQEQVGRRRAPVSLISFRCPFSPFLSTGIISGAAYCVPHRRPYSLALSSWSILSIREAALILFLFLVLFVDNCWHLALPRVARHLDNKGGSYLRPSHYTSRPPPSNGHEYSGGQTSLSPMESNRCSC
jgi:hypothetical protein